MDEATFNNVKRRLISLGYSPHEAEYNASKAQSWSADRSQPKPELLSKGSETKLKASANDIFNAYKSKAGRLAYGAGPLGALFFEKINEGSYEKIQTAINDNPIANWSVLQNIDATKQSATDILRGVPSEQGGLMNNFFTNTAASVGGIVQNVDKTAENVAGIAEKITYTAANLTDPNTSIPWLLIIGGIGIAAFILLK